MLRYAWALMAGMLFVAALLAHVATFAGIDPMEAFPGVMFLHLLIFPPFLAAFYYARGNRDLNSLLKAAPWPLRGAALVFFVYGILNFAVFWLRGARDGSPATVASLSAERRAGLSPGAQYVLQQHGRILREINEAEFHQQQAYIVRGFSGHWMLFSIASVAILVGSARRQREGIENDALGRTVK